MNCHYVRKGGVCIGSGSVGLGGVYVFEVLERFVGKLINSDSLSNTTNYFD